MPDLLHSLQSRDLGHLRIVAGLWGEELKSAEMEAALEELAAALLDPALVGEIVDSLSAEAKSALEVLIEEGGRMPWATFVRRFGEIREIGPGRRDREQVYLHPASAAETLFYRAFLARAFFDTPTGPQEFAYIPDDLLIIIHHEGHKGEKEKNVVPFVVNKGDEPLGRPAAPKERERPLPASDRLLDDATTLLAALRMDMQPPETIVPVNVVCGFLQAAGILAGDEPLADKVKSFLEMPRAQALSMLAEAWQTSETFNELRQIPGLVCEGEWKNSSLVTRHFLLAFLDTIPIDKWWSLPAFVHAIKEKYPDFQRPAGDYDSWFIRRTDSEAYLRGFEHWDEVDGALIRYFITGPLFWLGRIDLATPEGGKTVTAFRVVSNVEGQMSDARRSTFDEMGKLHVFSQGKITIPRLLPRAARYQISRFCEWEDVGRVAAGSRHLHSPALASGASVPQVQVYVPAGLLDHRRRIETMPDEYHYRVSTHSLKKAKEQGLKVRQLLSLLAKNAAAEIPLVFVKALKRWEVNGTEARIENLVILRVSRPEVLDELRKSKAGRFLGEILGPTTVIVKTGAQGKVLAALAEMGMLADVSHEEHQRDE